jgi:PAS domain S-box-containing protein
MTLRRAVAVYGVILAALGAALAARWLLNPLFNDSFPTITLFGAVAFALWLGGFRAATLAAALGWLFTARMILIPPSALGLNSSRNVLELIVFAFICGLLFVVGAFMQRTGRRGEGKPAIDDQTEALQIALAALSRANQRLATQDAVTRALADADSLDAAAPNILRAICAYLQWEVGGLWYVDSQERVLRCSAVWHMPAVKVSNFESATRSRTFEKGTGLPGRVWSTGKATWIPDVVHDDNFPRAHIAAQEGLHGAFGFPIVLEDEVLGAIEFFSHEIRQPDEELLQMMTAVGAQIGQFIERKRAERAHTTSEERFARFMQHLPGLAWIKDIEGRYVFANDAAEKAFRASRNELYGKTDEEIFPAEIAEHFRNNDRQALTAHMGVQVVETLEHEDGVLHHSIVSKFPIPGPAGDQTLVGGIAIDITERKQAEEALRTSEQLYRAIGESIDFGVWVCAPDGRNIYTSESFLQLVGMTQHECSNFGWAELLHPDDAERTVAAWKECVRNGGEWDVEHRFLGVDGEWHPVLARGVPVRNERGEITAWAGINLDISRLKHVENELRDADHRKDEFLATLAHELRNPLAPIRNMLEVLKRSDDDGAIVCEARESIERQLAQLVRLVDDLLDVSRITRDRLELRKEPVDISAVVRQAIETCRPLIDEMGHNLIVTMPQTQLFVQADPVRLSQVLGNLLNNACKFTSQGGHIWLTVARREGDVAVALKDNGVGIAPQMLPKVFDMFTQLDRSLERSHGGLGIGLTLVKRLVELHGGSITASSQGAGHGSEFIVRLPVLSETFSKIAPGPAAADVFPIGRRILVVDDNRDSAKSLAKLLTLTGNEAHTAHDGLEAIAIAEKLRPDVVLLDIGLPKMNGYDVCRAIRQMSWGKDIILVALTGWGKDDDRRQSMEAGFDGHLVKPVELGVLMSLLAELERAPVCQ